MTQTAVPASLSRRPRLALVAAVLAVLSLAACGGENAGTGRSAAPAAVTAGAERAAGDADRTGPAWPARPVAAGRTSDALFAAVLDEVARGCPSGPRQGPPPPAPAPTVADGSTAAAAAAEDAARDGAPPVVPDGPVLAVERELDQNDWCAMIRHEERVTQALLGLDAPTPASVRKALHHIGYTDAHIHDVEQAGAATRFVLDLRRGDGGRLCLQATADGAHSVAEGCVVPAEGPFNPAARRR
ncbi:hypothetical protein [Streptomyces sp. NPDC057695]|uniref:hypothetical protein n=1 Tax=Streptomyces sp. NPDC057695 TaxID=3346217 RepID=UPI00367564D2